MKNYTDITLENFQEKREFLVEIVIREQNKCDSFEKPKLPWGAKRLFAYSDVFPEEGGTLEEVTDNKQFEEVIKKAKEGRFGTYFGELDTVFITIYSLVA